MAEEPTYLDIDKVARRYSSSANALYSQRHRGSNPGALAVRVGKKLLWRESDLETWWEQTRSAGDAG